MTPLGKRMFDELQLRNYADFTIERYWDAVQKFAEFFGKSPQRFGAEQVRKFLLHLVQERKLAPSTVQIHRAALKFLYVRRDHSASRSHHESEAWGEDRNVVCDGTALQRTWQPQDQRYRQPAHGHSRPRRQRWGSA